MLLGKHIKKIEFSYNSIPNKFNKNLNNKNA